VAWRGDPGSSYAAYEFNENMDAEPGAFGVTGDNSDWIGPIGPFDFGIVLCMVEKTGWGAFEMFNFGESVGEKFMRVQMTYMWDSDGDGQFGERYDGLHLAGESNFGELGWHGLDIPILHKESDNEKQTGNSKTRRMAGETPVSGSS
jgi:hypothetical protein